MNHRCIALCMCMIVATAAAALLCACSANKIDTPRPIPTHITFDVAEGTWGVACEGTGLADQYPKAVAVLSTWQGETREGVWFVPGTKGYEKAVVSTKRFAAWNPADHVQLVAVPNFIEPRGAGWKVVLGDKPIQLSIEELEKKATYEMAVPIRCPAGQTKGPESSIERESRTL